MLHRAQLLRELEAVSDKLFYDLSGQLDLARTAWDQLKADPNLLEKITACQAPWPLPLWQGAIDTIVPVAPINKPYQLLSVDGSQVYPDKHQGTSCFLINIGTVQLQYGTGLKGITLDSAPQVFTEFSKEFDRQSTSSVDLVNCKREELELKAGLDTALQMKNKSDAPLLFLFDGSLIFWHLASKEQNLKDHFLKQYFELLKQFEQNKIVVAGYISLPKSKELINIVRTVLCNYNSASKAYEKIEYLVDTSIARFFLSSGHRSTVFKSQTPVTELYPQMIAPYFFYFDVGSEIIRVEVPRYVAENKESLSMIGGIILDQVQKGGGFPVGLAEAHEQAVVKGPDREFFYHLIEKIGIRQKRNIQLSQKSRKKRAIAV